jgi:protein-tyrosine phosphatase
MSLICEKLGNPFLFLGSCVDAHDFNFLQENKITHILNTADEISNKFPNEIKYLKLGMDDDEHFEIEKNFSKAHKFIDEIYSSDQVVLVHCQAGISRSATIVISYLMKFQKMKLKESMEHIKKRRKIIQPNIGFLRKLIEFEFEIFGENSMSYKECVLDSLSEMFYGIDSKLLQEQYEKNNGNVDEIIQSLMKILFP